MKILLTGVTGYIGKRLLPVLLEDGHEVVCCVRDKARFNIDPLKGKKVHVIEVDLLNKSTLSAIPKDIDVAYYLIHSMTASTEDFNDLEKTCAENFKNRINGTQARQVVYLSGIVNDKDLSKHLLSRKIVEETLALGDYQLTTLRAGIIIGAGSASFEMIRDLIEKLPIMIAPKWLKTRSQPIAIRNVIQFLKGVLLLETTYGKSFDIGGPDIMTYKDLLLRFAKMRGLKRLIINVPVMTPRLSSYWLYFVTSTSYKLAVNLVDSMKVEVVCEPNDLHERLNINLLNYEEALNLAFDKIAQQEVISSWTDALTNNKLEKGIGNLLNVPSYGCLKDAKVVTVKDSKETVKKIFSIGGENGWYYADRLWEIRGAIDKMVGGVGARRGRKNQNSINAGEVLDFWRVIYSSTSEKRLLLYAEMKLPGEAWLEFKIQDGELHQTATFRPKGLLGRLYWFSLLPAHIFIFKGMAQRLAA